MSIINQVLLTVALVACISVVLSQDPLDLPRNYVEFLRVQGSGTWMYVCVDNKIFVLSQANGRLQQLNQASVGVGTFYLSRPVANQNNITALFGIGGPSVTFNQIATGPSTHGNSLANALFSVVPNVTTSGPLQGVQFAKQLNTRGGVLPNPACNVNGRTEQANFTADFAFYKSS